MRRLTKPVTARIHFAIQPEWFDESEVIEDDLWYKSSVFLESLNGWMIDGEKFLPKPFQCEVKLQVRKPNTLDRKLLTTIAPLAVLDGWIIEARAIFPQVAEIQALNRSHGIRTDREVIERTCKNELQSFISKLLVLMSAYFPGSSDCSFSRCRDALEFGPGFGCSSSFSGASVLMRRCGIDPMPNFSFAQMLNWSENLPGFWHGKSSTNVSRAMNFFSHSHHRQREQGSITDLVWLMGALEALFAETNSDIKQKIARRALSLSPDIGKFSSRKKLGQLYDFRSRFLHGDLAIPNAFETDHRQNYYEREFWEAGDMALATYCKTIQALAERGWHTLEFEEVAKGVAGT